MFLNEITNGIFALIMSKKMSPKLEWEATDHSHPTSNDMKDIMSNLKRYHKDFYLALEIHPEACPEISRKIINEVKSFKWIESERAGGNLWEIHGEEDAQIIVAGKQWASRYWNDFQEAHKCPCMN